MISIIIQAKGIKDYREGEFAGQNKVNNQIYPHFLSDKEERIIAGADCIIRKIE